MLNLRNGAHVKLHLSTGSDGFLRANEDYAVGPARGQSSYLSSLIPTALEVLTKREANPD